MIRRNSAVVMLAATAVLVAVAVAVASTAALPVLAQPVSPNDPYDNVPVIWYATQSPDGLYHLNDPIIQSTTTITDGRWEMLPSHGAFDMLPSETKFGVMATPITGPVGTQARVVAGIWQAEIQRFSPNPKTAFQYLDVGFWINVNDNWIVGDTPPDIDRGKDETDTQGDALCPMPGCPHTFTASPHGGSIPLGVVYFMDVIVNPPGCPKETFNLTTRPGIGGGGMPQTYLCVNKLGGQLWNCLADGNCHEFG